MKIIVSPAKKMRSEVDGVDARSVPVFLEQSRQLADHLKTLSLEELRRLLGCNDALARLNYNLSADGSGSKGRAGPAFL